MYITEINETPFCIQIRKKVSGIKSITMYQLNGMYANS